MLEFAGLFATVVAAAAGSDAARKVVERWLEHARAEREKANRDSAKWSRLHYTLGLPAALLSGLAGFAAWADQKWITIAFAIASTAFSIAYVFLKPSDKLAEAQQRVGRHEEQVREFEAAIAIEFDANEEEKERLRQLLSRLGKIGSSAPSTVVEQAAGNRIEKALQETSTTGSESDPKAP